MRIATKFALHLLLALAAAGSSKTNAAPAAPPDVELVTDGDQLQPSSTIEIRFSRPIIAREDVNGNAVDSPIVFDPALPGRFIWLSRQTGVYSPNDTPPLGVEYTITARPDLKSADGKPIGRAFRTRLHTPPFGISAHRSDGDEENAPPRPKVRLGFNSAVELKDQERLFSFVNDEGARVTANVRYATAADHFNLKPIDDDWDQRWQQARHPNPSNKSAEDAEDDESSDQTPTAPEDPIPNRLIVTPSTNLTPGRKWRIEIAPGLHSRSGKYQIAQPASFTLGLVRPFVLNTLTPASFINSGRMLTLDFSRPLAPDVADEKGIRFFHITPAVPNLRLEEGYEAVTLRGDFERGKQYRLEIDPAVISADGLSLEANQPRTFEFPPVKPRLYLPQITGHQLRGGNRKFEVLSTNLKSLRVIARLVAPASAAKAIDAFSKYDRDPGSSDDPDEMYQKLPADAITGKVISEQTIEVQSPSIDSQQHTMLDWDKIVGEKIAGVVFLTVEGEPLAEVGGKASGAQALVQITDIGVLWKKVEDQLRISVFSHTNAHNLSGARVAMLNDAFRPFQTATTDSNGAASLPISEQPAWLIVQQDNDVHALRMGPAASELPIPNAIPTLYRDWAAASPKKQTTRAFMFTDRPLYQAGEDVKVKGIVRRTGPDGLERDGRHNGIITLMNSRGDQVSEAKVQTDERGAFDSSVSLRSVPVGHVTLQLKLAQGEDETTDAAACGFEIAAYQANAFELNVAAPKRLRGDEQLRATVNGKYFFGAPLTKAQARWTLRYIRPAFAPEGFGDFHFGKAEESKENALTLRGEGAIGGGSEFVIAPKLPTPIGVPRQGVLTVEVTDINQQTVSDTERFVHDASAFYIGIADPQRSVIRAGEEMSVRAIAIQPDEQPLRESVDVKTELIHLRHDTVRMQGAGNAITFRTDTTEEKIGEAGGKTLAARKDGDAWKPVDGETAKFKPAAAGQYRLRVTAKDQAGHEVISESDFYVAGRDEATWDYRNAAQLDLVADKQEYRAGDTARVLVKTPISGEAMITIEREERVLRSMRVRLDGNAPTIDVPINATDAPNIFVSMVLIRGSEASTRKFKTPEYRYGMCMLRVANPVNNLQVSIAPARREVQPGDEFEAEIGVRDGNGAAVENAEVTFFAVDDGILALTGYTRPMPLATFEEAFPLAVKTGLTLFELMPEDPAELEFSNKGYLIGGGGGEGPGSKLRHDFPGTACWMPNLRTDRDGKVHTRFRAPDALTRYRLVAVAHARTSMFGSGESAFTIRKPLLLLPAVGQFGNVGDELNARVVVRNDTGANGTVDVNLELDATAESAKPTNARVAVPNGEARTLDFPVKFRNVGNANWKWSAHVESNGTVFEDHVVSVLAVGSPMLTLRETYLADAREKTNDMLAGVNPQVLEGSGSIALTVANTRLASLRGSVAHLREYPYGCAEQTVSALIPWLVLPDLGPVLPELTKGDQDHAIQIGIDKMTSMQTSSGGLAFWPGGQRPDLLPSAYAAIALAVLEHQGKANPNLRDKLCEYLSAELRGMSKLRDETALSERALALYALASFGKPEAAYHEELYRRRAELSHESRALLALAISESGGPAAMVTDLLDVHKPAPEAFSWYGGEARETAIELLAWTRFKPKAPEVARLTNELLAFRVNGRWRTTQENAWALMALAQYYTKVERGGGSAQGTLVFGDRQVPFGVTRDHPAKSQSFMFGGPNRLSGLRVENPQKAPLFSETEFVVHPPLGAQPRQDRGFAVSRSYRKVADDGSMQEAGDLKVGDRVLVTLRVEASRPGRFVAIDDPLPAIFESVNPAFASRASAGGQEAEIDYVSDYREMHADRVMIFCDSLPAGEFTFGYLARVRSAGSATAPSAKVEEMYHPERFGICETTQVTSRAAD